MVAQAFTGRFTIGPSWRSQPDADHFHRDSLKPPRPNTTSPYARDQFRPVATVDVNWDALGSDHDLDDYFDRIDRVRLEDADC